MSFLKWPAKDPNAVKDYDINWSPFLVDGDTLATSTWIFPEEEITKNSDSFTTTRTKIWLSGGVAGRSVTFVNRITTTGGRTEDQSVVLKIKEK